MPKLDLYKLGELGVDLTNSVVHSEDGTFVQAQNAVPDRRGEAGALTKRDGLTAINSSAMSTPLRGAVHVPLTLAGASGTHRVYVGLQVAATSRGHGWSHSSDSWATAGTTVTSSPAAPSQDQYSTITHRGAQSAVTVNNKIYYFGEHETSSANATPPTIRVWDGSVDREFVRIPINPDTWASAYTMALLQMIAVGTTLYVTVWDAGTTDANFQGSVISVNTITGQVTRIGATFPTGKLPNALAWHLGRLWVGTRSIGTNTALVYFIRPGIDTAWTADETFAANNETISSLVEYKGKLYAALGSASNLITATVQVRDPSNGTWAASDTGDAGVISHYYSFVVFKNNLYVLYRKSTPVGRIRKFDGSSWSTVASEATGRFVSLFQHFGTIYAFSIVDEAVIVSTDGTSWSAQRTVTADATLNVVNGVAAIVL